MHVVSCFNPSSTPIPTCVLSPSCRLYTGAQIAVENRESSMTCRLTTAKTRCFLGSVCPGLRTKNRSPRRIYSGNPWYSRTSAASAFSRSACRSNMLASLKSQACFEECAKYASAARSRNAERFESTLSISSSNALGSVTDVLTFIPPRYHD